VSATGEQRPIIIVKRPKKGGAAHHGGAWKVAYADFVTAMMAFFMVMWLIAAVSKEQRAAIFDYFKNPSMEPGKSPKPSQGQMGPGGASTSVINLRGGLDARKSSTPLSSGLGTPHDSSAKDNLLAPTPPTPPSSLEEARKMAEAADHKKIVDAQNRAMFDLGSAKLKDYTASILHELAPYLNSVPNHISLSGHTDTTPYVAQRGYTNWDLSADRANAARRALEGGGLASDKVARVVGLSSAVLFDKENSRNPINRRISIIVMTKEAEDSASKTEEVPASELPGASSAMASAAPDSAAAPPAADSTPVAH